MNDIITKVRDALVDRYTLDQEIGSGGMAIVYLATDIKHDRRVALKVLRPELAAAVGVERFLREIQIVAKLNHPHILPLYDSGEEDGFLYYVMPFVEGESLRDRLSREKQLPVEDVLKYAHETADALEYAHKHGVVHRDIKPENILLEEGHAVIADFGIAKAISAAGGENLTATGLAVGTPTYMSPEQAIGSGDIDSRSDIYSLACVIYEMFAGQAPFIGPTAESIISQHLTSDPPEVTKIRSAIPVDITDVLTRAMEKAPADRYQSASQFNEALITASHSVPKKKTTKIAQSAVRKPAGEKRGIRLAGLIAVAVIVTVIVIRMILPSGRYQSLVDELLPLAQAGNLNEVYSRVQSEDLDPRHKKLKPLTDLAFGYLSITSEPSSVEVSIRRVQPISEFSEREPINIGRTPLDAYPLVAGEYLVRFTVEDFILLEYLSTLRVGDEISFFHELVEATDPWKNMVIVNEGRSPVQKGEDPIPAFLIDRYEVTNAEYLEFVSQHGYQNADYWPETLLINDRQVPWSPDLREFVDRTGIHGPEDWSSGRYPDGKANHPVVGISWYEASAYARWAGKKLPNWNQWWRAAIGDSAYVFPWGNDPFTTDERSNFGGGDSLPIGSFPLGVSVFGCYDMAGNVREWLIDGYNGELQISVVGGSWQDPVYMFEPVHEELFDPSYRGGAIGFRLVTTIPRR